MTTKIHKTPPSAKWSGKQPIPPLGSIVQVTINSIGKATVLGYFEQDGWLGVFVQPENPPKWYVEQNGAEAACHVFGAELSAPPPARIPEPPEGSDDNDNDNILADEFGREYIDLTPTWKSCAGIIRLALESGTPTGRKAATEELFRMADAADRWNAHCKAERARGIGNAIAGKEDER